MPRPTNLPEWATGEDAQIVAPPAEIISKGWTAIKIPFQWLNHWFHNVFKWLEWHDEQEQAHSTAISQHGTTIGEHTTAISTINSNISSISDQIDNAELNISRLQKMLYFSGSCFPGDSWDGSTSKTIQMQYVSVPAGSRLTLRSLAFAGFGDDSFTIEAREPADGVPLISSYECVAGEDLITGRWKDSPNHIMYTNSSAIDEDVLLYFKIVQGNAATDISSEGGWFANFEVQTVPV